MTRPCSTMIDETLAVETDPKFHGCDGLVPPRRRHPVRADHIASDAFFSVPVLTTVQVPA